MEDNVTCFSCEDECRSRKCFDFVFMERHFKFLRIRRVEKSTSSLSASINHKHLPSYATLLSSDPPKYPQSNCSAYHLTRPLPVLCVCVLGGEGFLFSFSEIEEMQLMRFKGNLNIGEIGVESYSMCLLSLNLFRKSEAAV